jgi:hypothetical protein
MKKEDAYFPGTSLFSELKRAYRTGSRTTTKEADHPVTMDFVSARPMVSLSRRFLETSARAIGHRRFAARSLAVSR